MGLQRIGEDLATEEEQQQLQNYYCQVAKKKKNKATWFQWTKENSARKGNHVFYSVWTKSDNSYT